MTNIKSHPNRFKKSERLCSKREIAALHDSGKSFLEYPIRTVYMVSSALVNNITEELESGQSEASQPDTNDTQQSLPIGVSSESYEPLRVLIVAPKRLFKHAVDRNLLKRRIREAYRMNNHALKEYLVKEQISLALQLSYVAKEILDYHTIERAIKKIFEELVNRSVSTTD